MNADIQGALNQINKAYRAFEHNGMPMKKEQVKAVLEYGLKQGYKGIDEISNAEVEAVLNKLLEGK